MTLEELTDNELDSILGLSIERRIKYFETMISRYFPNTEEGSSYHQELLETYISSFFTEKLYRNNRFFNEKFTPVYTNTGLIRNIIADIYFNSDDLITH